MKLKEVYELGRIILVVVLLICFKSYGQNAASNEKEELLFSENFSGELNKTLWLAEIEPIGKSSVHTVKDQLIMDTAGGVTVWFKQKLDGNIRIEYDWKVLVDSGRNDRLSDLNQFWMASDPRNPNLFTRSGKFETYDSLSLYYVGFGGNTNTTTRFRKYHGNGQKPLLKEYLDRKHLLKANQVYHISIVVLNEKMTFSVNDEVFFEYLDPNSLASGYFGFRSTQARHAISHFRVYRLL
jgi:rhamnogalacturonan endolyase